MFVRAFAACLFFYSLNSFAGCVSDSTSHVEVELAAHRLLLCRAGTAASAYKVALGRGGVGKKAAGDLKTPLGDYTLGAPKDSAKFYKFIPISYPSELQKKVGFTGADVGIHGPHRYFAWLGSLTTKLDWTQGCIALGSDKEVDEVASFLSAFSVSRISLLP